MPYQIQCSTCGLKLLVREHALGKLVRCTKCKTEFIAEAGAGEAIEEDREPAAPPRDRRDDAGVRSRPGDEDRDEDGREARRRERDWDRPDDRRGPRRGRDDEDERGPRRGPDDEDEEDRPRKRRRRRQSAEDKLWAPALALQIVAYAGGGFGLLSILLSLGGVLSATAHIPESRRSFICALAAILLALWVGVVAKGAAAMASQHSYGMAIAGCIMSMVPLSIGCLGGIPVGIWCLIILLQEDVKKAFE